MAGCSSASSLSVTNPKSMKQALTDQHILHRCQTRMESWKLRIEKYKVRIGKYKVRIACYKVIIVI